MSCITCSRTVKIKNGGLDPYDSEAFEQQQFGTAGAEGVNGSMRYVVATANSNTALFSELDGHVLTGNFTLVDMQ